MRRPARFALPCRSALRFEPLLALLLAACGGGTITVQPPPPPPPASFSVVLTPDAEDLVAAQALGWSSGIPGADVTLTPKDSSAAPRTVQSSASGIVDFGTIPAGTYILEARRWLTTAEVGKLPAGQDVDGWVAKTLLTSTGQGAQQRISVPASRRKGLVISEWAFNVAAPPPLNQSYFFGGYLKLYNNADTTAYLDGLTIAEGVVFEFDFPNYPCNVSSTYDDDARGIWTGLVQQFPGRGRDYPVLPGKSVVIAVDAIDHSKLISNGIDLSHADFDFYGGPADPINPAVPNMTDTLSMLPDVLGHGPVFQNSGSVLVFARPYDKATVLRSTTPSGKEVALIPADHVLDVVTLFPNYVPAWSRCPRLVNFRLDRASSDARAKGNESVEYEYSISRRALPTSLSSQAILQNTRNSDADFIRTRRSLGTAP